MPEDMGDQPMIKMQNGDGFRIEVFHSVGILLRRFERFDKIYVGKELYLFLSQILLPNEVFLVGVDRF